MHHIWRITQSLCMLFCLLVALSACSQNPSSTPSSTPTRPVAKPTSGPAITAQTCPTRLTARSAVMPAMTTGNHANIVYLITPNKDETSSTLQRYDTTSGSTSTILQTQATDTITRANLSPDGQWILFLAQMQGSTAIQLIRIDGQQLQTLYCAPAQMSIDAAILSPNQHFLVFNQVDQNEMSTLYLLDVTTGKLQTELSPLQPNYPGIAQNQSQGSWLSATTSSSSSNRAIYNARLQPLPGTHYLVYRPLKWASNKSVYLLGTISGGGELPHPLALLSDISKDVTQQQSNLQPISTASQYNECAMMPDNQQLACSSYIMMGPVSPSTLKIQPITGDTARTIYSNAAGGMLQARPISNSTLIFIYDQPGSPPSLWKVNTDGSRLSQLMTAKTNDETLSFAYDSYLPQSMISTDGTLYAITDSNMSGTASLMFGRLNGGAPTTIAANSYFLGLIGWSQL